MQAGYPEVVSSEIAKSRAPTWSAITEGNMRVSDEREHTFSPTESETPSMHRNFTRENREAPSTSVGAGRQTRKPGEGDEL